MNDIPTLPTPNPLADYQIATFRGAKLSNTGRALPDIWRMLRSNSALLVRFAQADSHRGNGSTRRAVLEAEEGIKPDLASIAAEDWAALCAAAGWTETGAAALSWCRDAAPEAVWAGFRATGMPPTADTAFFRAALLVRTSFLPKGLTLSSLFSASGNDFHAVCAALAVRPGSIRLDYSMAQVDQMPGFFRDFLAAPTINLISASAPVAAG